MPDNTINRRTFLAATGVTAATAATSGLSKAYAQSTESGPNVEWRNRQPEMAYRRLGRSNIMVSEIVFGGLSVKNDPEQWRFLETGIELGINYIDTATNYNRGDSERGIANVINTPSKRERIFITTKTSMWLKKGRADVYAKLHDSLNAREQGRVRAEVGARLKDRGVFEEYYLCNYGDWQITEAEKLIQDDVLEDWHGDKVPSEDRKGMVKALIEELEGSLTRLGTDYVDFLFAAHGATHPKHLMSDELLEAADTLKRQGKIRFLGTSAHNDPAYITRSAADSEHYTIAMVAYNISNKHWVEPALEYAKKKDLGIIAMKVARAPFPDRGGKVEPLPGLVEQMHKLIPGDMHVAEKAYLWALKNKNIAACVSAMNDEAMVRANAALAGKSPAV